jgi:hypothetical protein
MGRHVDTGRRASETVRRVMKIEKQLQCSVPHPKLPKAFGRSGLALMGLGLAVLIGGCSSASASGGSHSVVSPTSTSHPIDVTTSTAAPAGTTITETDGMKFSVRAGAPTRVVQYVNSQQSEIASPGQDFVEVKVAVKNLQVDRSAHLFDLVNGGTGGGLSVFIGLPAGDSNGGSCQASNGVYDAPPGYCVDTAGDTIIPGGNDVNTASELSEDPIIPPGGTVTITTYSEAVSTSSSLAGSALLFGIGNGPQMVVVPFG